MDDMDNIVIWLYFPIGFNLLIMMEKKPS